MKITKKTRIGILAGGPSSERDVSLRSGKKVQSSLEKQGYKTLLIDPKTESIDPEKVDIAFIALHGKYGEDGTIQQTLEDLNIPYTGSGVHASALAINKIKTKDVMLNHNIPTPHHCFPNKLEFAPPFIIKPISEGSSIGITIIQNMSEFDQWINHTKDIQDYFIEEYSLGKSITVGIIEEAHRPIALPILELRTKRDFYDYTAKYTKGETEFVIPAELSKQDTENAQSFSIQLHTILGCKGFSRVDLVVDPKRGPLILELNTIPGLTALSDLPAQANAVGISYDELILKLLYSATEKR